MTPPRPRLGRLEPANLREGWTGEALDFTPWLAQPENIALLGEAIGVELEVEAQEKSVGPFRADILAKDTTNGHYVLIENQLERTDHVHLGQLLTYAAGLDAVSVVWIASRFTDEHRAALDWLNRVTNESINMFGLEIELWRIGDSPMAPKFNVVCQPNDWQKTISAATGGGKGLTDVQQLHFDFWTQFRDHMQSRNSPVRVGKPSREQWTTVALGRAYFTLAIVNGTRDGGWTRLSLEMSGPQAKQHFHLLHERHKGELETKLGTLLWRELPDRQVSTVSFQRPATLADRESWGELDAWLAENVERWVTVLKPIVMSLDVSGNQPTPAEPVVDDGLR